MGTRAVFPGTFDPIHLGHIDIATRGATLFDELIVGVYDKPLKSLYFSFDEREALVKQALGHVSNIRVMGYSGLTVEFCQRVNAQVVLRGLRVFSDFEYEFRMALANRRLAPHLDMVALMSDEQHTFLSGTTVREIAMLGGDISTMVPDFVAEALYMRARENDNEPTNTLRD